MTSPASRQASKAVLLPLLLVLAASVYRFAKLKGFITLGFVENFTPWMALAFTGTLVFPKRVHFAAIPMLLILIGIAATSVQDVFHWEAIAVYGFFALAAWAASRLRGRLGLVSALLGTAACSLTFYAVTNTVSWLSDPLYAKTVMGWVQALTQGNGTPGLPPTYWFLGQSLVSDLLFSCVLLASYNTEAALRRQPAIPLLSPAAA